MTKRIFILFALIQIALFGNLFAQNDNFAIAEGPYLQQVGNNEATVVWTTNRDAVAWVEIAPNDGSHFYAKERKQYYHTILGRKNIGKLHKVIIDSLLPNTSYRYRIFTKEVKSVTSFGAEYGKVVASNVYSKQPLAFTTLDDTKSTANVLFVNDIHQREDLFTRLIGNEDLNKVDFVMLNGDMVNQFESEKVLFDGFLSKASELFAAEKPMFMVRGNHETRGLSSHKFMDYFPSSTGKPYYTFKQGPAIFVVLDPGEDKPDNDIEYFGLADFDKYRESEVQWLKSVIESKEYKEAEVKIVVIHIPPVGGTWHGNLELNRLFMPLLNSADVSLMMCAHEHRHRFMEKGADGANFPMLVNKNTHSVYLEITPNNIGVRIKDDEGKLFKNISIEL